MHAPSFKKASGPSVGTTGTITGTPLVTKVLETIKIALLTDTSTKWPWGRTGYVLGSKLVQTEGDNIVTALDARPPNYEKILPLLQGPQLEPDDLNRVINSFIKLSQDKNVDPDQIKAISSKVGDLPKMSADQHLRIRDELRQWPKLQEDFLNKASVLMDPVDLAQKLVTAETLKFIAKQKMPGEVQGASPLEFIVEKALNSEYLNKLEEGTACHLIENAIYLVLLDKGNFSEDMYEKFQELISMGIDRDADIKGVIKQSFRVASKLSEPEIALENFNTKLSATGFQLRLGEPYPGERGDQ